MAAIKSNLAKNIAELRKNAGMTQIDLAQKLNYSDKAVSKWERAESFPDISTLVEMADLFGVSLDTLVRASDPSLACVPEKVGVDRAYRKRTVITILGVVLVWFIALAAFVSVFYFAPNITWEWMFFVGAVPVGAVVWLVLNTVWLNRRMNYLIISVLTWSALATLHLAFLLCGLHLWMVYLLGIPAQIGIIVWSCMRGKKSLPKASGKTENTEK